MAAFLSGVTLVNCQSKRELAAGLFVISHSKDFENVFLDAET